MRKENEGTHEGGGHCLHVSGMSKRAIGSASVTVTRSLCIYWLKMIEGVKTYKPEFKASKSDKWL